MTLGPPWARTPDWWSLDGIPMRVRVPETTSLVMALTIPDHRGAGMWTTIALTADADRTTLVDAVLRRGPAVDAVLDDVADVLVEQTLGWKRWEAAWVWRQTLGAWPIVDGDLTAAGVDLTTLTAARATNTAFSWWRRNLGRDEKAWKKWIRDMEKEPVRAIERAAAEPMAASSFDQLGQVGKTKRQAVVPTSTIQMP